MIKRLSAVCIILALSMAGCTKGSTTTNVNKNSVEVTAAKQEEKKCYYLRV